MSIPKIVQKGLALIIGVVGLYLILESPILGREAAFLYISGFKSFDTPEYLQLMDRFIFSYQLAGGILLTIGLWHLLKLDQKTKG
ncbi:hypothetical protein AV540_07135 [Brevibacillus parabrevis]|uniref:hypothetical protein n=1 Tax=Brevibacillus parabrevis TaxID=54914 RepID=UPI0007AB5676|nr:hypothetical protein [Brevibacillus parabrevis]KZE53995.1 hypothetical protein AV540_07135 [Brevibacillus parabrevis]